MSVLLKTQTRFSILLFSRSKGVCLTGIIINPTVNHRIDFNYKCQFYFTIANFDVALKLPLKTEM